MKRKIVSLILCVVIILGAGSGCDGQLTVDNEQLTIENPENEPEIIAEEPEPAEEIDVYNEPMTMEFLERINFRLPKITYNDDGNIIRIEDRGTSSSPENIISLIPVFNEDDARAVIDSYLGLFGLDENIDLRFERKHNRTFHFAQFYEDLKVERAGIFIVSNYDTGLVTLINNSYIPDLNIDTPPIISLEEAMRKINSVYGENVINEDRYTLMIYVNNDREAELAWGIDVTDHYFIMSAQTGEILSYDTYIFYQIGSSNIENLIERIQNG
jgi:hypothetical protein